MAVVNFQLTPSEMTHEKSIRKFAHIIPQDNLTSWLPIAVTYTDRPVAFENFRFVIAGTIDTTGTTIDVFSAANGTDVIGGSPTIDSTTRLITQITLSDTLDIGAVTSGDPTDSSTVAAGNTLVSGGKTVWVKVAWANTTTAPVVGAPLLVQWTERTHNL